MLTGQDKLFKLRANNILKLYFFLICSLERDKKYIVSFRGVVQIGGSDTGFSHVGPTKVKAC